MPPTHSVPQGRSGLLRALIWLVGVSAVVTLGIAALLWSWLALFSVGYGYSPTGDSARWAATMALPWFLAQVAVGGVLLVLGRRIELFRSFPAFAEGLLSWVVAFSLASPLLELIRVLLW